MRNRIQFLHLSILCILVLLSVATPVWAQPKKQFENADLIPRSYLQKSTKMPVETSDPTNAINRTWEPKQRLHVFDMNLKKLKEVNTPVNSSVYMQRIGNSDYFYVTDVFQKHIAFYKFGENLNFSRVKRSDVPKKLLANFKVSRVIGAIRKPEINNVYDQKTGILKGRTNRKVRCLYITDDNTMFCLFRGEKPKEYREIARVDLKDGKILGKNEIKGPWDKAEMIRLLPVAVRQIFIWNDRVLLLSGTDGVAYLDTSRGIK